MPNTPRPTRPSTARFLTQIQAAVKLQNAGELDRAATIYREVMRLEPTHPDALNNLAVIRKTQGKYDEALDLYTRSIKFHPRFVSSYANLGNLFKVLGRLDEALLQLGRAVEIDPEFHNARNTLALVYIELGKFEQAYEHLMKLVKVEYRLDETYNILGNLYFAQEKYEEAKKHYERAVVVNPGFADALSNLGTVAKRLGEFQQAKLYYNAAHAQYPDNATYLFNLGVAHEDEGLLSEAEHYYLRSLVLDRRRIDTLGNLAGLYRKLKRYTEAEKLYTEAKEIAPERADTLNNLGAVCFDQKRYVESISFYDQAIDLKPTYAEAHNNKGVSLKQLGRFSDAVEYFNRAALLDLSYAEPLLNLSTLYQTTGDYLSSIATLEEALNRQPGNATCIWYRAIRRIVPISAEGPDGGLHEEEIIRGLEDAEADLLGLRSRVLPEAVATNTPFYLAYYDRNNKKILQCYGSMVTRLMEKWRSELNLEAPLRVETERARIGIFTHHVIDHSVWNAITKGIITNLPRGSFEIFLYYPEPDSDHETSEASRLVDRFMQRQQTLEAWYRDIFIDDLDILIYPDIGMRTLSTQLAGLRLAPTQLATWGHPETTGLPTIDFYISAQAFEPPDPESRYTEQVITLPGLGSYYQPLSYTSSHFETEQIGLNRNYKWVVNPGTPFKYSPRNDEIYLDILEAAADSQFIFFKNDLAKGLSDSFEERIISKAKARHGNLERRIVFVKWLPRDLFYALLRESTVMLDTIGFSGFNTAMQAIENNTPVIAYEGNYLRGRLCSGILHELGMEKYVAHSPGEFIKLATELINSPREVNLIRREIETRKHKVFRQTHGIEKLAQELISLRYAAKEKKSRRTL
jgi:predicted O-linked N-acetylglucosamine transferase (SPINDLY family)